jgi:DNA-binding Lrp family transcriptional regulator
MSHLLRRVWEDQTIRSRGDLLVLLALTMTGPATPAVIARMVRSDHWTVRVRLRSLQERGRVERIGAEYRLVPITAGRSREKEVRG